MVLLYDSQAVVPDVLGPPVGPNSTSGFSGSGVGVESSSSSGTIGAGAGVGSAALDSVSGKISESEDETNSVVVTRVSPSPQC